MCGTVNKHVRKKTYGMCRKLMNTNSNAAKALLFIV